MEVTLMFFYCSVTQYISATLRQLQLQCSCLHFHPFLVTLISTCARSPTSVCLIWLAGLNGWRGGEKRWVAASYPSSSPSPFLFPTGAMAYSAGVAEGEGTPGRLFPLMACRVQMHFPRLTRWMVTNSRGRGLCERCTVYQADSSWQALWGGLKAVLAACDPAL